MFDIAPTELLLCAIVALVVIGPKDLPKAMRVLGYWVGRVRGVARHFRSGIDTMIRESELDEMQKKWAEENARIMREHPYLPDPEPADERAADEAEAAMMPLPTPPDAPAPEQADAPPAPRPDGPEGERG